MGFYDDFNNEGIRVHSKISGCFLPEGTMIGKCEVGYLSGYYGTTIKGVLRVDAQEGASGIAIDPEQIKSIVSQSIYDNKLLLIGRNLNGSSVISMLTVDVDLLCPELGVILTSKLSHGIAEGALVCFADGTHKPQSFGISSGGQKIKDGEFSKLLRVPKKGSIVKSLVPNLPNDDLIAAYVLDSLNSVKGSSFIYKGQSSERS